MHIVTSKRVTKKRSVQIGFILATIYSIYNLPYSLFVWSIWTAIFIRFDCFNFLPTLSKKARNIYSHVILAITGEIYLHLFIFSSWTLFAIILLAGVLSGWTAAKLNLYWIKQERADSKNEDKSTIRKQEREINKLMDERDKLQLDLLLAQRKIDSHTGKYEEIKTRLKLSIQKTEQLQDEIKYYKEWCKYYESVLPDGEASEELMAAELTTNEAGTSSRAEESDSSICESLKEYSELSESLKKDAVISDTLKEDKLDIQDTLKEDDVDLERQQDDSIARNCAVNIQDDADLKRQQEQNPEIKGRDKKIMDCLTAGMSIRQTATACSCSVGTVAGTKKKYVALLNN